MKREDVEALLAAAQGAGPADPVFGEELFGVEAPTLAALCRRWLAVEDSPSVEINACNQIEGARDFDYGDMQAAVQKFDVGQRVRIVPEDGQGGGGE